VLRYIELPDDSLEKQQMEKRLGKKHLVKLVGKYKEEEENKKWLEASTTACPGCSTPVEKNMVGGCAAMITDSDYWAGLQPCKL